MIDRAKARRDEVMVNADTVARSGDTGRVVGTVGGVIAGAEVGTVCIPVPIVGTLVGAVLGGVLGSEGGRWLGRTAMNITGVVVNTGALTLRPLTSKLAHTFDAVKPVQPPTGR